MAKRDTGNQALERIPSLKREKQPKKLKKDDWRSLANGSKLRMHNACCETWLQMHTVLNAILQGETVHAELPCTLWPNDTLKTTMTGRGYTPILLWRHRSRHSSYLTGCFASWVTFAYFLTESMRFEIYGHCDPCYQSRVDGLIQNN